MAKGVSLHVGINRASSDFPGAPTLVGCENDARAMHDIARSRGFSRRDLLLGSEATYKRVVAAIKQAAHNPVDELIAGDIFLFTFAGHGSGKFDQSGDESDNQDETILLFDRMLFDDVLERELWPLFNPGVRILMVSDSCHSGTVHELTETATSVRRTEYLSPGDREATRTIPEFTRSQHLKDFEAFYKAELDKLPAAASIGASVLLLAACRDLEEAGDGAPHGVFTKALLKVWAGGGFTRNYKEFRDAIEAEIPPGKQQHPQLNLTGQTLNPEFRFRKPVFAI